jgi:glycine hydroxymethyltransferase
LFGSTHKSLFGPQGGIILADKEHGEIIESQIHPGLVDNAHWNRVAALTMALEEMLKFGKAYVKQVVANAQVLGKALAQSGFPAACQELGYTKSHQVYLDFGGYRQGRKVARKLEKTNIIVDCGIRVGVCEATRRGMKRTEMHRIAEFMERAAIKEENTNKVKSDVEQFMEDFQGIEYCFEPV